MSATSSNFQKPTRSSQLHKNLSIGDYKRSIQSPLQLTTGSDFGELLKRLNLSSIPPSHSERTASLKHHTSHSPPLPSSSDSISQSWRGSLLGARSLWLTSGWWCPDEHWTIVVGSVYIFLHLGFYLLARSVDQLVDCFQFKTNLLIPSTHRQTSLSSSSSLDRQRYSSSFLCFWVASRLFSRVSCSICSIEPRAFSRVRVTHVHSTIGITIMARMEVSWQLFISQADIPFWKFLFLYCFPLKLHVKLSPFTQPFPMTFPSS